MRPRWKPRLPSPRPLDPDAVARRGRRRRRWRRIRGEVIVAAAALCLSLSVVATNVWVAWRGSEVLAVPPTSVFLYRDAGTGAVLTAGVDTALVNTASGNHGDVVTRVIMEIDDGSDPPAAFRYDTLVTPVFSEQAERQYADCPVTARCVRNGQFLSIEEPRRTLDVPGGTSRSEYVGFVLQQGYCSTGANCREYRDFLTAAQTLQRRPVLTIRFHYTLHSDGEKVAECRVNLWGPGSGRGSTWLSSHLQAKGWVVLPCSP